MVYRQEVLCDVVLVAGATELSCHKVVLCSCSQYFYAMFTGELSESKSDRITLQEMDPEALVLLIDFVYTSEIHVTEENVQVSFELAFLQIRHFVNKNTDTFLFLRHF